MMEKIRIEDHTVIPFDIVNIEFEDVNAFLEFVHDENRCININMSKAPWGQWVACIQADKEFLEACRSDGACGSCGNKLDPSVPLKPVNELHVEGRVVCGYCGNVLRYQKSPALLDVFNELTGQGDVPT